LSRLRNQSLRLQFGRFYLIIIGFLCLFILILSIVSLINQSHVAQSFSLKDLSLKGEMLASELERRTWHLAEACLNDPDLASALAAQEIPRATLLNLAKRHPIAENFFLLQDGSLRFPLLTAPAPRLPFSFPENLPAKRQFTALFQAAETDAARGMYSQAIAGYEKCSTMTVPDQWKAEAFLHLARCYAATKKPTDAVRTYDRLERDYGDNLDDNKWPYAAIAALEADGLERNRTIVSNDLQIIYDDLIEGRWQLSAAVTEQLKSKLEKYSGIAVRAEKTRYLKQFDAARVIDRELHGTRAKPYEIFSQVVSSNPGIQTFGVVLPDKIGGTKILAFSVDLDWVSGPLLAECRQDLYSDEAPIPAFKIGPKISDASTDVTLPFLSVFNFLQLQLPLSAVGANKQAIRIEIWLAGSSAILMACLLCMIVILLLRINREINSLQVRTDFLGHISHELKTPLTLILLYCETLLSDDQIDRDRRRGYYRVIVREGERLKQLIGNLLYLARIEKTKSEYKIVEGDMAGVIEKTFHACKEWLGTIGFEVSLNIAPELPPVRFDSERVAQSLMNLLDNACKYSGESKKVEISLYPEGSSVILEVRDYGRGIPASEQKKVFEEFYRATNTGVESGTGLGLYLVRRTVEAHGGSVELESKEGIGSCFRLIFPARSPMVADSKGLVESSILTSSNS